MFTRDRSNIKADPRSKITSEEIVCQFIQDLDAGEFPCPETIAAQYPALAPALLQDLRIALSIHSARQEATREEIPYTETEEFSKEIARLQEELPAFSLLCRLEHGGQGAVYKAIQVSTGRTVALKILLDVPIFAGKRRERFEREIELVSRLQHPNIVTIFESGVVVDRPFYAMEYIDGLPIDDYFLANRPTVEEAARIFSMITRAVAHAHKRGIIHRDLKPLNILVDLDGQPHVLDFGLAKELESQSDSNGGISITGQVVGTLPYLSPEQASGDPDEVDTRSDVYSLGVIFYRLLTGTYPYVVEGDPNIVRANILASEPKSFKKTLDGADPAIRSTSDVAHDDIERIVLKSLSKDKERRYQSADALADDLDRFARGEAVLAKADSTIYVLRKTLRKYRLQVAFAATLAVVLAVSSIVTGIQWRRAATERDNAREVASLTHAAFSDITNEIEEVISTLAGGTEVRNRLFGRIPNLLEQLRKKVESDSSMVPLLAQIREKQGDVANVLAKSDDARSAYSDSLQLSHQLNDSSSGLDLAPTIVRLYRKLASLPGDAKEQLFKNAVTTAIANLLSNPNTKTMDYEACRSFIDYTQFLFDNGKYEDASNQLQQSGVLLEKNKERVIRLGNWKELSAVYFGLLGRIQGKTGDSAKAIDNLCRCKDIRLELSNATPSNILLRNQLRLAQLNLATQYRLASQSSNAIELLNASIETGKYLCLMEPQTMDWKEELYRTYEILAQSNLDLGDSRIEEANNSSEAMMNIVETMVKADAQAARPMIARAFALQGKINIANKRWLDAEFNFESAIDNQEILALKDDLVAKRNLAFYLDSLGKCRRARDNSDGAIDCYKRAYNIRNELLASHPSILDYQLDIIVSLSNIAAWESDANTASADARANVLLDKAENILLKLQHEGKLQLYDKRFQKYSDGISNIRCSITGTGP